MKVIIFILCAFVLSPAHAAQVSTNCDAINASRIVGKNISKPTAQTIRKGSSKQ